MRKILIKVGGSLLAPKDKKWIDLNYLIWLNKFLSELQDSIFLVHWTGNIGHGWVRSIMKEGLSVKEVVKQYYQEGRKVLDNFFEEIDKVLGLKRLNIQSFLWNPYFLAWWIIGGDILPSGDIVSSDDIFQTVLEKEQVDLALVLTDVDGVLDENNQVIPFIDKLSWLKFWEKAWDVTGGMKAKVEKILLTHKPVIICNGYDFSNIKQWLSTWKWYWTLILGK